MNMETEKNIMRTNSENRQVVSAGLTKGDDDMRELLKKIINERTNLDTVLLADEHTKELIITNWTKTTSAAENYIEIFRLDGDIPKNWEIEDDELGKCYLQDLPEEEQDEYILYVLSKEGVDYTIKEALENLGVPESSIEKCLDS